MASKNGGIPLEEQQRLHTSSALDMCTDRKMEEMAAAMKAVADAAKADKARQEWLESEIAKQTSRANAIELEKAALQDRVQQLEVALEEQGTKAALAWKWQQEVARLQEKLGKRSVELLATKQDLGKLKTQLQEVSSEAAALKVQLKSTQDKLAAAETATAESREAHVQDVNDLKSKLSHAHERIGEVETAYETLREQASTEIHDLRCKLADMSDKLGKMSGRLKETNDKLTYTMNARAASRKKYNKLAEQLMMLSRAAGAACSSGGGAPGIHAHNEIRSPFDGPVADGRQGKGADENVSNYGITAAASANGGDNSRSQTGFKSSLNYANVSLAVDPKPASRGVTSSSGASVSSTGSKRGMFSMLKTTGIAAVAAVMSPREGKSGKSSSKREQQQEETNISSSAKGDSSRIQQSHRSSDPYNTGAMKRAYTAEPSSNRGRSYTTSGVTVNGGNGISRTTSSMSAAPISAYQCGIAPQRQSKAVVLVGETSMVTADECFIDAGTESDGSHYAAMGAVSD